jgi:hypothetical protein
VADLTPKGPKSLGGGQLELWAASIISNLESNGK